MLTDQPQNTFLDGKDHNQVLVDLLTRMTSVEQRVSAMEAKAKAVVQPIPAPKPALVVPVATPIPAPVAPVLPVITAKPNIASILSKVEAVAAVAVPIVESAVASAQAKN